MNKPCRDAYARRGKKMKPTQSAPGSLCPCLIFRNGFSRKLSKLCTSTLHLGRSRSRPPAHLRACRRVVGARGAGAETPRPPARRARATNCTQRVEFLDCLQTSWSACHASITLTQLMMVLTRCCVPHADATQRKLVGRVDAGKATSASATQIRMMPGTAIHLGREQCNVPYTACCY